MALSILSKRAQRIKEKASRKGFDFCGIAKAEKLDSEQAKLEQWLSRGMHGEMLYMENHFEKRLDPTKLVPGAKSVISLTYNYYPSNDLAETSGYKIAKYAYGEDYHFVIKRKLKNLVVELQEEIGDFGARIFVDSAPVMERAWASRSGIGWIGKNSLLLNQKMGSFFFLAFIITDLELAYDNTVTDHCGSCTACIDACPTDAIPEPYIVDASKCISYFTIELKNKIPEGNEEKCNNWIFGCDICQDICPWNSFSKPNTEPNFQPNIKLESMKREDWLEITEEVFDEIFRNSAVRRTGYLGLKRNIEYLESKK